MLTFAFLDFFQASDEAIHCVHFFGSYDYGFVTAADIKLYGENRATKGRVRGKPAVFANAVKEIEEALAAESNLSAVSKEDPRPYFVMENPNVPAIRYGHCNLFAFLLGDRIDPFFVKIVLIFPSYSSATGGVHLNGLCRRQT